MSKFMNGKAVGKDKITGEMVKGGGNRMVDCIWWLCNMAFESGVMPEDWRSEICHCTRVKERRLNVRII